MIHNSLSLPNVFVFHFVSLYLPLIICIFLLYPMLLSLYDRTKIATWDY
jgi:hypothetical protein